MTLAGERALEVVDAWRGRTCGFFEGGCGVSFEGLHLVAVASS